MKKWNFIIYFGTEEKEITGSLKCRTKPLTKEDVLSLIKIEMSKYNNSIAWELK